MSTVVTIMDRGSWQAYTDNIVVVEPARKRLLWVPRDLWCECLADRINRAFALGGHDLLRAALEEHRLEATEGLCLRREAPERALRDMIVTVPVKNRLVFWYPLEPQRPVEEGRKIVVFEPPEERLAGERIHQWIGARYSAAEPSEGEGFASIAMANVRRTAARVLITLRRRMGSYPTPLGALPDLDRIERQKILLRALLRENFRFATALENPEWVWRSSERALEELRNVRASWSFHTLDEVEPRTIKGMQVLVNRRPHATRSFSAM